MRSLALLCALSTALAAAEPLPDKAAIESAQRQVRDTYGDELTSEEGLRKVLAAADGLKSPENQAATYIVVAQQAASSGWLRIGFAAIDRLAKRFDYDALEAKARMLEGAVKRARTVEDRVSMVNRCLELLDEATRQERFDVGESAVKLASQTVAKLKDADLRKELADKRKSFEKLKKESDAEWKRTTEAESILNRNQNDPHANETLGRRYASLDDWGRAIPRLAKADDEDLRTAALADLAAQKDPAKQIVAADAWWRAAESTGGKEQRVYRARSVFWYSTALPSLTELSKARAEKRIEEAGTVDLTGQTVGDDSKITILLAPGVPLSLVRIPASADGKVQSLWLGATEVSQRQWVAVMSNNPASHKGDDLPIKNIDAAQCLEFCQKVNGMMPRFHVRLPTEVEWEYAFGSPEQYARDYAGTTWCELNSGNKAHPVGKLKPNAFGLFDMLGNVRERVGDGSVGLGIDFGTPRGNGAFDRQEIGAKSYLDNTGFRIAAEPK